MRHQERRWANVEWYEMAATVGLENCSASGTLDHELHHIQEMLTARPGGFSSSECFVGLFWQLPPISMQWVPFRALTCRRASACYSCAETPWWASEWCFNLIMKAPLNQKREKCLCLWHKIFCVTTEVIWDRPAVEIVIQVCQQWLTTMVAADKFQLLSTCVWRFWY